MAPCSVVSRGHAALFALALTAAAFRAEAASIGGCHIPSQQAARVDSPSVRSARVRGIDQRAQSLLQEGKSRSPTFRGLLEAIERSDLIVYVQTGALDRPGALLFVAATPHARFLRIRIRAAGRPDDEMIAWLGHELQHAVEIAADRSVRHEQGILALFRRIGSVGRSTCETRAAERVWARVLDEVRYSGRPRHRLDRVPR